MGVAFPDGQIPVLRTLARSLLLRLAMTSEGEGFRAGIAEGKASSHLPAGLGWGWGRDDSANDHRRTPLSKLR